jgi:hypothetical protein
MKDRIFQHSPYIVIVQLLHKKDHREHNFQHTLDGQLDFCGFDPALQLYRRLCRHDYDIDPVATVFYVNSYREMWDEESLPKPDAPKDKLKGMTK